MRFESCLVAFAVLLATVPGGARRAVAADGKTVIKVATLVPRSQQMAIDEKRTNARLMEATQGRVQFKTYWGGTAGDDTTVMRKIRSGQIDAAPLGADVVAQYVHQASVLMTPQTFFNYRQVDAVRAELAADFNKEAWDNGFKITSWWDAGRVRIFSKKPVQTFADLRSGRPWVYPQSQLLKEFYKMIKVTGVPLDLNEVYGGLQTNMIDTVWISAVLGAALRWASVTEYVSATPVSVIQGAFLIRRPCWEGIREDDRKALEEIMHETAAQQQQDFRKGDDRTYAKLLKRGMKAVEFKNEEEWAAAGKTLRTRLIGRTYTKELLDRVEAITKKYPGE